MRALLLWLLTYYGIARVVEIASGVIAHNVVIYARIVISNAGFPSKFLQALPFE